MTQRDLLPLKIGDVTFAVDALAVEEVLGPCEIIAVPEAPATMPGLVLWRSRAIAVLDLARLTGAGAPLDAGEVRPRTIVARHADCHLALPVHQVREVQHVLEVHPTVAGGTPPPFCVGEAKLDGVPMAVIDLPALVQSFSDEGGSRA